MIFICIHTSSVYQYLRVFFLFDDGMWNGLFILLSSMIDMSTDSSDKGKISTGVDTRGMSMMASLPHSIAKLFSHPVAPHESLFPSNKFHSYAVSILKFCFGYPSTIIYKTKSVLSVKKKAFRQNATYAKPFFRPNKFLFPIRNRQYVCKFLSIELVKKDFRGGIFYFQT